MNPDLARLFQLGELPIKRHARLTKVASASEGENQGAVVGVPLVCMQDGELVANLDFVRVGTVFSEPIYEKNRPNHHGQDDHSYIGRYLEFSFHHRYLRALSKAELSSNSAATRRHGSRRGAELFRCQNSESAISLGRQGAKSICFACR